MPSLLFPDDTSLLCVDAFGITRFAFGKQVKVKHSPKAASARGAVSVNAGATVALVSGRVFATAYGHEGVCTFGLPALGLRDKTTFSTPYAITTTPSGDKMVGLEGTKAVQVRDLGSGLQASRTINLETSAALTLAPITLGHQDVSGWNETSLCTTPDGGFLVHSAGTVFAGEIGADATHDTVWWALPVTTSPASEVTLTRTGTTVWIAVRDSTRETVEIVTISRDGEVRHVEGLHGAASWPSLTAPVLDGATVLTQPDSDTVVATSLADGSRTVFSVAAYNTHPAEEPEASAFPQGRPPAPTRRPGTLGLYKGRRYFLPWHAEYVVDLVVGTTFSRGLPASHGPFRRLVQEHLLTLSEGTRHVGAEVVLGGFEVHPKYGTVSLHTLLPGMPNTLLGSLASGLVNTLWQRVELATHGVRWGGLSARGGYVTNLTRADLATTRAALAWMHGQGWVPLEFSGPLVRRFHDGMGIPFDAQPDTLPFTPEGERLFLRALLATLHTRRWPDTVDFDAWSATPVTAAEAEAAVHDFRMPSHFPQDDHHLLAKSLAQHLGPDALPALLRLLDNATGDTPDANQAHTAGEAIAWVVHRHPDHRDATLAALDPLVTRPIADASARQWVALTQERVARGARHFSSNA